MTGYGLARGRTWCPPFVLVCLALVVTGSLAAQAPLRRDARADRPRLGVALLEVTAFNILLQRFNAWVRRADWAQITPRDWSRNLREGWVWDVDQYQTNMFGHPYGGGFHFNAGRDNGLGFWGSVPITFFGSVTWEYFAENEPPSLNDLYTTGFGGVIYGEVGHRLGHLIRDDRARGATRVLREVAALPFDPVGSLNRMMRGQLTRVRNDPDDRDRSAFMVELQGGARLAVDSGPARTRSVSATFLVDIAYGDAFGHTPPRPFDVFRARLQVSPARGPVNTARIRGRLFGREITDTAAAARHVLTIAQKTDYMSGPAYKFGGQSLEAGLVSLFTLGSAVHLQTEGYLEWLVLGALDAPGAGVRERAYDFGPGAGLNGAATLVVAGHHVLSARYRYAFVHSVSGSPADHSTNFLSVEARVPLGRSLGLGAYAGWYRQRSTYTRPDRATLTFPEYRGFVTWRRGRGPVPLEATSGAAP